MRAADPEISSKMSASPLERITPSLGALTRQDAALPRGDTLAGALALRPQLAVLTAFWIYVALSNVLYANSMQASFEHEDGARVRAVGRAGDPAPGAVPAVPAVHVEIDANRLAAFVARNSAAARVCARIRGARLAVAGSRRVPDARVAPRGMDPQRLRQDLGQLAGFCHPRNPDLGREHHELPGHLRLRSGAGHGLRLLSAPARLAAALRGARARAHPRAPGGAAHAALAAHALQPAAYHPRADRLGPAGGPGDGGAARRSAAAAPERRGARVLAPLG